MTMCMLSNPSLFLFVDPFNMQKKHLIPIVKTILDVYNNLSPTILRFCIEYENHHTINVLKRNREAKVFLSKAWKLKSHLQRLPFLWSAAFPDLYEMIYIIFLVWQCSLPRYTFYTSLFAALCLQSLLTCPVPHKYDSIHPQPIHPWHHHLCAGSLTQASPAVPADPWSCGLVFAHFHL